MTTANTPDPLPANSGDPSTDLNAARAELDNLKIRRVVLDVLLLVSPVDPSQYGVPLATLDAECRAQTAELEQRTIPALVAACDAIASGKG